MLVCKNAVRFRSLAIMHCKSIFNIYIYIYVIFFILVVLDTLDKSNNIESFLPSSNSYHLVRRAKCPILYETRLITLVTRLIVNLNDRNYDEIEALTFYSFSIEFD